MTSKIKLVSGDSRPFVRVTLKGSDGLPINLSDADTSIQVFFRAVGESAILSTIACSKPTGGADGVVSFNFSGGVLNVPAGQYEGEVEVSFGGQQQTVYEPLKFTVREQFA